MRRKQTDFSHVPCYGMTAEAVARAYGSENIRRRLEAIGELKPFFRNKTFKLYDRNDVAQAWLRFRKGETSIPIS